MHATATAPESMTDTVISLPLVSLSFPQHITELLQRAPVELRLLPQVRRQEAIRVTYSHEGSLECVFKGFRRAGGGSVDILDAGELEETLDGWGSDEAGTTGCRDELANNHYLIPSVKKLMKLTRTVTEPHLPLSFVGSE